MADGVEQTTFLPEEVFSFEIVRLADSASGERTDEPLVARGGLVLPHQLAQALGLPRKIDRELPAPGSPRGMSPSAFVLPLLLMLHGGGRALEDLRELRTGMGTCPLGRRRWPFWSDVVRRCPLVRG